MKSLWLSLLLLLPASGVWADELATVQTPLGTLPREIVRGSTSPSGNLHVQGVQVDVKRGYIYYSFTTELVKTDLRGQVVGSVTGLTCHLGCIELDTESGKLYGSMEYKNDNIGKGVLKALGRTQGGQGQGNYFYIGIFDTDKITREGMNPSTDGVLKTAYLPEVVEMYGAKVNQGGQLRDHQYGCSGIDGISKGPQFGKTQGKRYVNVALGIYSDLKRTDNDYQVILQYDPAKLEQVARPLVAGQFHKSGLKAEKRYFYYTGNTNWGVQNLDYDPYTHYWMAAVYTGRKPGFPNYSLFAIDGTRKAKRQALRGLQPTERGLVLQQAAAGLQDQTTGVRGWRFADGSTGLESLGGGYYYISHPGRDSQGRQQCTLSLYRWTGKDDGPFEKVK